MCAEKRKKASVAAVQVGQGRNGPSFDERGSGQIMQDFIFQDKKFL